MVLPFFVDSVFENIVSFKLRSVDPGQNDGTSVNTIPWQGNPTSLHPALELVVSTSAALISRMTAWVGSKVQRCSKSYNSVIAVVVMKCFDESREMNLLVEDRSSQEKLLTWWKSLMLRVKQPM